jgi:flagellum-specific peptidoglycan hydrolase FlgJ/LysM repeat protein
MLKINFKIYKLSTYFLCFLLLLISSCGTTKKVNTSSKANKTAQNRNPQSRPVAVVSPNKNENNQATASSSSSNQTLEATSTIKVTPQNVQEYIETFKPVAKNNMRTHRIPASIIMAQGILESGIGRGRLAKEANNHFGIKCHKEWTGDAIYHDDDQSGECFRKYRDASESYRDHALFLSSRSRYNFLFELEKDDYKGWANGLKNAGYATDPKYPEKLIGLIERYELFLLDAEVLGKTKIVTNEIVNPISKPETNKEVNVIKPVENVTKPVAEIKPQPSKTNQDFHIVEVGQTLYGISRLYNLNTDELMKINQLESTNLAVGQKLNINKSDSKPLIQPEQDEKNTHLVSAGDTLFNISKRYGLTVDQLKQLNQLPDNNISLGQILKIK